MAEGAGKSVLVTGGSGYLGGWCIVELIRRGYQVRTTVRDLAREPQVRESVSSQVDPGGRLSFSAADLGSDAGWAEAVAGCDFVLHVASPFPAKQPKDPDELIVPAREGTLRVLRASLEAGVKRIVVTSSIAAVTGATAAGRPLDERDWSDPESPRLTPYARSKTIAERAAWDLARERGAEDRVAIVNPGAIIGPLMHDDLSYSLQAVERLLRGTPGIPRIGLSLVDVRDVAELEVAAISAPAAGGERFIAATRFLWMAEIGEILRTRLGPAASKVPTRVVPNPIVRAMSLFDPGIRSIIGILGKRTEVSSEKARRTLGWAPRPIEDTVAETAESLFAHGVVPNPVPTAEARAG